MRDFRDLSTFCAFVLLAAVALTGRSETSVSDVVVNQRWPWSEKVDVDFTLTGETSDVDVCATWDTLRGDAAPGVATPVLLGTVFAATPGQNRFSWDPANSPWAGQTLTGFSVTLTPAAAAAHTYLVVDLEKGGVSYLAEVPSGGWSDEYKTKKMVFRRVPAGSYALGMSAGELSCWYGDSSTKLYKEEKLLRGARTQVFSSDFYLAVFQMTEGQYAAVEAGTAGASLLPKLINYDELRGTTNATDGICWPTSRYAVAGNSFLQKIRSRVCVALTIDLPEEEQWEAALRAGSTAVFPNGGTTDSTDAELWDVFGTSAWYSGNGGTEMRAVGLKSADNALGFYDMMGNRVEWTLDIWLVDTYGRPTKINGGTDPVGASIWRDTSKTTDPDYIARINGAYGQRVVRSVFRNSKGTTLQSVLPSYRSSRSPQAGNCTARLCIHLKPLNFGN